jgi:two-component system chemotaxis response regulator CheB
VVLIGTSTGGPGTLEEILPLLPADFAHPVVVAQHMPGSFTRALANRLDTICPLRVVEVAGPLPLQPGHIFIGRGECDVVVQQRFKETIVRPVPAGAEYLWHPSVERMVRSALEAFAPEQLIAVQLTGMGYDGAEAMTEVRKRGGHTVAESADSAVVFGMPKELIDRGGAEVVLPAPRIAAQVLKWG